MTVEKFQKKVALTVTTESPPTKGRSAQKSELRIALDALDAGQKVTVPDGWEGDPIEKVQKRCAHIVSGIRSTERLRRSGKKFCVRNYSDRVDIYRTE